MRHPRRRRGSIKPPLSLDYGESAGAIEAILSALEALLRVYEALLTLYSLLRQY